jgi:uncharacterized protein YcfL
MAMKKCLSLFVSLFLLVVVGCLSEESFAQQALIWQQVRQKFYLPIRLSRHDASASRSSGRRNPPFARPGLGICTGGRG